MSASGGNERSTFYFSASRFDQNVVTENTDFNKSFSRITAETKLSDKLKIGGSANYINTQNSFALQGSGVADTNIIGAAGGGGGGTMRGIYNWPLNDDMRNHMSPNGTQRTILGVAQDAAFIDNPYWSIFNNPNNSNVNCMITMANLSCDPVDFLNITYRAGTDFLIESIVA